MISNHDENSLLRDAFTSNATAQQATQKGATIDATATQQATLKPLSLLDIARNKLRNMHATTAENTTQQAPNIKGQALSITQHPLDPAHVAAILKWLAFIGEVDPACIAEVLEQCRGETDAMEYFLERSKEAV